VKTKIVHNISQLLKKVILFFLSILLLYLISALFLSLLRTRPIELSCRADKEISISTNGVHLDIVLPVEYVHPELLEKLNILKGTKYVSFGWGDQEFYINTPTWADLTFPIAFNALFLKSKTVMHVTCYQSSYQSWRRLDLCNSQLDLLNQYIESSFTKKENGNLIKLDVKGYYKSDSFFEAQGSFFFYRTCNIWVNKALKKIGVSTSIWSPFDLGILYHLPE